MSMLVRIMISLVLVAILLYAGFGFLTVIKLPGLLMWKIGYSAVMLACLAGIAWLLIWKRKPSEQDP